MKIKKKRSAWLHNPFPKYQLLFNQNYYYGSSPSVLAATPSVPAPLSVTHIVSSSSLSSSLSSVIVVVVAVVVAFSSCSVCAAIEASIVLGVHVNSQNSALLVEVELVARFQQQSILFLTGKSRHLMSSQ
jgi:hypothetical protein